MLIVKTERSFQLLPTLLEYSTNDVVKGSISIAQNSKVEKVEDTECDFTVTCQEGSKRLLNLRASSTEERDSWIAAIASAINDAIALEAAMTEAEKALSEAEKAKQLEVQRHAAMLEMHTHHGML